MITTAYFLMCKLHLQESVRYTGKVILNRIKKICKKYLINPGLPRIFLLFGWYKQASLLPQLNFSAFKIPAILYSKYKETRIICRFLTFY
jgi:hypothetical protein